MNERAGESAALPGASRRLELAWSQIEQTGWLSGRSPEVSRRLRGIARLRRFGSGQNLYHRGDGASGLFGLVSGSLDITIPRVDGRDLTFHRADPGFWVGDLAFFAHQGRLITVRAASPSVLVHLPREPLEELLARHPALYADFYEMTYSHVQMMLRFIAQLSISPSEVRVGLRLLMHAETLPPGEHWIRLSQETLAELLGLSVPTLQRALRKLETDGLIEVGYGRIRIADRAGLLQLTGESVASAAVSP